MARMVIRELDDGDFFCGELGKAGRVDECPNGDIMFIFINEQDREDAFRRKRYDVELILNG